MATMATADNRQGLRLIPGAEDPRGMECEVPRADWPRHDRAEPLRAVVVDSDPDCLALAHRALAGTGGVVVAGEESQADRGLDLVVRERASLVFIGLDDAAAAVDLTAQLCEICPEAIVLVSTPATSPELVKRAMRAGAREYLSRPPEQAEIEEAVRRLLRLRAHATRPVPAPGDIIAVFAAKGGLGATFIATNLAVLLAGMGRRRTAIVDLNLELGDVDTFLNLKADHSIAELADQDQAPMGLDTAAIESWLARHRSGLRMLAEPSDAGAAAVDLAPGAVGRVLTRLRGSFEHVVVDVARRFDDQTIEVLDHADQILLVSALDLPAIRNTRRCIETCTRLGYRGRLKLVLNRHRQAKVTERLERAFGLPVFWHLPEDAATAVSAINAGVPATEVGAETELAASLQGLAVALAADESHATAPISKGRSGLLRRLLAPA